jgi:hypothetical protein
MQAEQLAASKSASDQHGEDRVIPFAAERIRNQTRQKPFALLGGEPVPDTNSNPAHSLNPSDSGCKFRTEQAGVGGLVGDPPNGGEA